MELEKYDLQPQQQLAVSLYLKSMNKSQAAKDAGYSTTRVFDAPTVKAAIDEQLSIRANRLRIGADWVLSESVKVYNRCMQTEKILDRDGNHTGEFKFDASNAIKALTLIGKHVDIKAFDIPLATHSEIEIMGRLQRGRQRIALKQPLLPDSDLEDEESLDVDCESCSAPELDEEPPVSFLEPHNYQYTKVVHVLEGIEDLITPEKKMELLMERWRTGAPPVNSK